MKDRPPDKNAALSYLTSAISRTEKGQVLGSHLVGVFTKAANPFEKAVREHLEALMRSCDLNYDHDVRPAAQNRPFSKLTLGNCVAAIKEAARLRPECIAAAMPRDRQVDDLLAILKKVNEVWVAVKHGDPVGAPVMLDGLKSMREVYADFFGPR